MRTTSLSVQFLKLTRGEPLLIEARVISQSKQLIAVEADVRLENEDLIAKATAQRIVVAFRAALTA